MLLFFQPDELEEGEIAISGDSHMDHQQSGSWVHDRDEGEDEQVLQPKIKRKRSIRVRPRHTVERAEEKSGNEPSLQRLDSSLMPFQIDHKFKPQLRTEVHGDSNSLKNDQSEPSSKSRRNLPSKRTANAPKLRASPKSGRLNSISVPADDASEHGKESWDNKVTNAGGSSNPGVKMSDVIQRRVCAILS